MYHFPLKLPLFHLVSTKVFFSRSKEKYEDIKKNKIRHVKQYSFIFTKIHYKVLKQVECKHYILSEMALFSVHISVSREDLSWVLYRF